jgi:hypothetical protein
LHNKYKKFEVKIKNKLKYRIMKQLFINGKATILFFNDGDSNERIAEWINFRMHDIDNPFNLNEKWSARVEHMIDDTIHIVGDEDSVLITLEKIFPINISYYA